MIRVYMMEGGGNEDGVKMVIRALYKSINVSERRNEIKGSTWPLNLNSVDKNL